MSAIIEDLARATNRSIFGLQPTDISRTQTERGHQLIKQLATGGLALGAGTGAAVALVNYLKSLQEEAELLDDSRMNDDTLYVRMPEKSASPSVNRWLAPGVAVTGGVLSAGAAYALTKAIYNKIQKKRRQSLIDMAQQEALMAADEEVAKLDKKAAEGKTPVTFSDLVAAFPVAVPLLAALASGGVAYAALNKTFPVVKKPKSKHPKRIRQVASDGAARPVDAEADTLAKRARRELASAHDQDSAAQEWLVLLTDAVAMHKRADVSLTSDILNRVARDGAAPLLRTYEHAGVAGVVESVKGASITPADHGAKVVAAARLMKSAALRPLVATIAAAEFFDLQPGVAGVLAEQGVAYAADMCKAASLIQLATNRAVILEKAAMDPQLAALLELQEELDFDAPYVAEDDAEDQAEDQAEKSLTSDAGGSLMEEVDGEDADIDGEAGDTWHRADPVDQFLVGNSPLEL
jgi:hypothetical protein